VYSAKYQCFKKKMKKVATSPLADACPRE